MLDISLPESSGDGGGSSESTARSSGRRGCGDTVDAFETKSEREASEAQVQKGSPDILKLVPTETADKRPGCDADDGSARQDSSRTYGGSQ